MEDKPESSPRSHGPDSPAFFKEPPPRGSCPRWDKNWADVQLFYDTNGPVFRGSLCLFLLHMGAVAG